MPSGTSIVLENGTKGIVDSAFNGCTRLTGITIPDSVTSIGWSAFENCTRLTSITIPDSVTSIGNYAFFYCKSLTGITIPDSVTSIGDAAFRGCTSLTITCPLYSFAETYAKGKNIPYVNDFSGITGDCSWIFDNGVLTINGNGKMSDDYRFGDMSWKNDIKSVIISDGVTGIGSSAFNGCTKLKSAVIPESVTVIGSDVFENCSSVLSVYGFIGSSADNYCKNNSINFLSLYEYSDLGNNKLKITQCNFVDYYGNLSIPSSIGGKTVTQIGEWFVANNTKVKSVSIPDTVTIISKGAFYNCTEIKTVTMGNNVTEIGLSAFEKCIQLESINLSSKLETIGDEAFYDCRRLKTLDIPATVTSIGEEAFTNCRSLQSLVIPNGVQTLGSDNSTGFGMFENCKSLSEITIPKSVGFIQENAFDGCSNVTINCIKNTCAYKYAADNNIAYNATVSESIGDANANGTVNVTDVTSIQRHVSELQQIPEDNLLDADTNGDGVVDINDATYLQMYLAEFDVELG